MDKERKDDTNYKKKTKRNFFKKDRRRSSSEKAQNHKRRIGEMKKGIFILPSLLTLTSIFLSFYSVISAIKGQYPLAAALILVAGFFDGIDGKVARLTKTSTKFGLELDSLADVISFGMAPAILMYIWGLEPYGRIGWVSCFVFVACGALRLARFNVLTGSIDPKRFQGLPIPMAAAMIATTVLFFQKLDISPRNYIIAMFILTYSLSFLMVSGVKFHAFKDLTMAKQKPFSATVAFVLILALIAASPQIVPFFLCAGYVISGPILTFYLRSRERKNKEALGTEADSESVDGESESDLSPKGLLS